MIGNAGPLRSTSSPSSASCTSGISCPECGAGGAASRAECEQRFQTLGIERFDDSELASDWRLIVDCYAMQHDAYILSGRSLAAHLTGVGIAMEHAGDPSLLAAMQRWLSSIRDIARPEVPVERGLITINEVIAALPEDRHALVLQWAASVWSAWSAQQALARGWIAAAR